MWGNIYNSTWWGEPQQDEWGNTYYPYTDVFITFKKNKREQ